MIQSTLMKKEPISFLVVIDKAPASTIECIDLSTGLFHYKDIATQYKHPELIHPDNLKKGFLLLWKILPDDKIYSQLVKNKRFYHYCLNGCLGRLRGPYVSVFEHGEIYGGHWKILIKNFSGFERKLGKWIDLVPLDQDSYNEIVKESKYRMIYIYYGTGKRAHSYKVRSFVRKQLPKQYKKLYRRSRVGLKLPSGFLSREDFFHSLLDKEEEDFLNKTFGSWRHFYKIVNNPAKFNLSQKTLNDFLVK